MNSTGKVAIIDCGTNTFHLLLAAISPEGFRMLHEEKTTVKIGEGGIENRTITPEAMERAVSCIRNYAQKINEAGIRDVHAFATSAFRNAGNGVSLRNQIEDETGIGIRIIAGDEEAGFICDGVRFALDIGEKPQLIMDIGGGSVEFIIASQEELFWKQSFEIGAQRLLDRFFKSDPISPDAVIQLQLSLSEELQPLNAAIRQYKPTFLIGASGTFDTLSDMFAFREGREPESVQAELPLTVNAYYSIHETLLKSNQAERLALPGMVAMRVDMIVVASCLIDFVLKVSGISKIRVSRYALKEGVLSGMINS